MRMLDVHVHHTQPQGTPVKKAAANGSASKSDRGGNADDSGDDEEDEDDNDEAEEEALQDTEMLQASVGGCGGDEDRRMHYRVSMS